VKVLANVSSKRQCQIIELHEVTAVVKAGGEIERLTA
jgi:hypothetical protein